MSKTFGEEVANDFIKAISEHILATGKKQAHIAKEIGMSNSTLSRILTKTTKPSFVDLMNLAVYVGVEIEYHLNGIYKE